MKGKTRDPLSLKLPPPSRLISITISFLRHAFYNKSKMFPHMLVVFVPLGGNYEWLLPPSVHDS